MTVFASTPRTTRRPRRIPSVASLVRVLATVRVSDHPAQTCPGSYGARGPQAQIHAHGSRGAAARTG